ncbi:spermidine N1-acetyltransferase [Virgibacillus sp. NKC19-3]|uniref:spermidine N1-acetyltransferase n=1 Tax=Virgibacillus saliphilus TaxID=2831674 RepID=UPI001C9AD99C|nr:spermidine N1-acetyltransferase [Virgibacillus sp. NKC19-3]MBY7144179.1 spermidine N1-acetyltransferase [Virgibacillus sp. NKC19-3]
MDEEIGLRTLEKEDLEFIHTLHNNADIMSYWFEEAYKSMATLKDQYDKNMSNPHVRHFILKKGNKKLGLVELVAIDPIHRKAEFTIMIDPTYQGNGYASKATCLAMDYAFSTLNLHKLYLIVDQINEKAIHIYKKAGFQIEAQLKDEYFVNGTYHHAVIMCMFQEDYFSMN